MVVRIRLKPCVLGDSLQLRCFSYRRCFRFRDVSVKKQKQEIWIKRFALSAVASLSERRKSTSIRRWFKSHKEKQNTFYMHIAQFLFCGLHDDAMCFVEPPSIVSNSRWWKGVLCAYDERVSGKQKKAFDEQKYKKRFNRNYCKTIHWKESRGNFCSLIEMCLESTPVIKSDLMFPLFVRLNWSQRQSWKRFHGGLKQRLWCNLFDC